MLIPRRVLFGDPGKFIVRISPDGARIAFLAPVDGVLNLWVAPIGDVNAARPLTRVTDRDLGPSLVWLPNDRHVVFFREHQGDENWQAHRLDVETGDALPLTPGSGVTCYIQQTSHHFPDELLIAHNGRNQRFFEIFRVNAATGENTLLQENDRFVGFLTDPQFQVRLALRMPTMGAASTCSAERTANGSRSRGSTWRMPWARGRSTSATTARSSIGSIRAVAIRRRWWRRTWPAARRGSSPRTPRPMSWNWRWSRRATARSPRRPCSRANAGR
jgi:dipeptidyl aminopeptidase/acylaminoacyl peptidase